MRKEFRSLLFFVIISLSAMAQQGNAHFKSIQKSLLNTKSNVVMIAAHRGAHNNVPENSLAAIKEAINLGIDIVELDIRFTKDRKISTSSIELSGAGSQLLISMALGFP